MYRSFVTHGVHPLLLWEMHLLLKWLKIGMLMNSENRCPNECQMHWLLSMTTSLFIKLKSGITASSCVARTSIDTTKSITTWNKILSTIPRIHDSLYFLFLTYSGNIANACWQLLWCFHIVRFQCNKTLLIVCTHLNFSRSQYEIYHLR